MEDGRFRNKIYWFTFFFSILVIWVHSANAEIYLGWSDEAYLLYAFENFIGNVIAQVAVPGFFMISAYLFYRNFSWNNLKLKWDSRIRTVLVPFIVWNFLYYMGYVIASRITWLKDVVGKGIIPFNLMAAGDAILNYTYNYVFWYLYQLILLILLAPVIYLVISNRYTAMAAGIAVLLAISCGYRLMYLNLDSLLYYGVAAYFAIHEKRTAEGKWSRQRMVLGMVLAAAGIASIILSAGGARAVFVVIFRLLIPVSLWLMVSEERLPKAKEWMKNNFFLYAIHFAFVRLINKTGAAVLPHVIEVPLTLYLCMPFLCILISNLLSAAIKKISPPVWILLTGGRRP